MRNEQEVIIDKRFHGPYFEEARSFRSANKYTLWCRLIGFCGKVYPALKGYVYTNPTALKSEYRMCYNIDEVDKYVREFWSKKAIEKYEAEPDKKRWDGGWSSESRFQIEAFLNKGNNSQYCYLAKYSRDILSFNSVEKMDIFRTYNVPIFTFRVGKSNNDRKGVLVLNDILRDYQFYKIFDAFSAYQELSMYVGGILNAHENKVPEISDADMIVAKGFDKYSFRKDKST